MRLKLDKDSDALYFRLDEATVGESEEVDPGVVLDFNAQGKVVGIAILNLGAREEIDEPFVVPAKAGTQNVIISDLAEEYA
jgi:uncharacterized protein YuzE